MTDYSAEERRLRKLGRAAIEKSPYRQGYHLMPPIGFLNDPNGLCELNGVYHVYYQYAPEGEGKSKMWGHYSTEDFVTWRSLPPVLFPDSARDANGVYSGSAYVENGIMNVFYTGNVRFDGDGDRERFFREHNTIYTSSADGKNFSDKILLMTNSSYPQDMTAHVRDPKVWKKDGRYYMLLGARDIMDRGLVLLYRSDNMKEWQLIKRISKNDTGYMWECPSYYESGAYKILSFCPQGMKSRGIEYSNYHLSGYCFADNSLESDEPCVLSDFREYDRGFDFYAPQDFMDSKGRRIQFGWMGVPDPTYLGWRNPEREYGWINCLTVPVVLGTAEDEGGIRVTRTPVEEMTKLRLDGQSWEISRFEGITADTLQFELVLEFQDKNTPFCLNIRRDSALSYDGKIMTLSLGRSGRGRKIRSARIYSAKEVRIFSDSSSLEIFADGESFTTRVYGSNPAAPIALSAEGAGRITFYKLKSYKIIEEE